MGDKKGKALALELMDDLLSENQTEAESPEGQDELANHEFSPATQVRPEESVADLAIDSDDLADPGFEFSNSVIHQTSPANPPGQRATVSPNTAVSKTMADPATVVANRKSPPEFPTTVPADDDRTVRLAEPHTAHTVRIHSATPSPVAERPPNTPPAGGEVRVRASVGRFGAFRGGATTNSTEAALAQSESLRIAQSRLLELETEIERLRTQNEQLAAAGETLRRRADELTASHQKRESDYRHAVSTFNQEKDILTQSKEAVQRELGLVRQKAEELEMRISTNIQKIRVRERELENRLELIKMESAAVVRSKDELILDLKRQVDQLNLELTNYRNKNQELNRQSTDKQEMLRRTVKALRLALSMLEGEEGSAATPSPAPLQRKVK